MGIGLSTRTSSTMMLSTHWEMDATGSKRMDSRETTSSPRKSTLSAYLAFTLTMLILKWSSSPLGFLERWISNTRTKCLRLRSTLRSFFPMLRSLGSRVTSTLDKVMRWLTMSALSTDFYSHTSHFHISHLLNTIMFLTIQLVAPGSQQLLKTLITPQRRTTNSTGPELISKPWIRTVF